MSNIEKNLNEEELPDVITLTDEETGEEIEFEVIATAEIDSKLYYALVPANEESDEYLILRVTEDGDDVIFETIEDDDEFEKAEETFNDMLFDEVDYDEK